MKQKTRRFISLFLLILLSFNLFSFLPFSSLETKETNAYSGNESWVDRYSYQVNHLDGTYTTSFYQGPQTFWNNKTRSWEQLLLEDHTDAVNPHFLIRNSYVTAKIGISDKWDLEGVLYYDPDYTKRICAEFWTPQGYLNDEWINLDAQYNSYELFYNETFINLTGKFRVYYGSTEVARMRISYILEPASDLKHEVELISLTPQTNQIRMILTFVGIPGRKLIHRLGETTITIDEQQIDSYRLRFVNSSNPRQQFFEEKLDALGHYEINGTGHLNWVNDYFRGARVKLVNYWGKQLVRLDIVIGNYTLDQNESLFIDPHTNTFYSVSGYDDAYEKGDGYFNYNAITLYIRRNDADNVRYHSGIRYDEITIPKDATILSAYSYLRIQAGTDDAYCTIYGNDVDDANNFYDEQDIKDTRTRTSASVSWASDGIGSGFQPTPDISSIIQEIVDRSGWEGENGIAILFIASTGTDKEVRWWGRDFGIKYASYLVVTWTTSDTMSNSFYVEHSYDDATEDGTGSFSYTHTLNIVDAYTDSGSSSYDCSGLKFNDINIPQGANILSASLWLYTQPATYDAVNCKIYGNDVDDANDFYDEQDVIDTRTRTTEFISWIHNDLGNDLWVQKTGLHDVVEEITNRTGWSNGNDLALLLIANTDNTWKCHFYSYDSSSSYAPYINIVWELEEGEGIFYVSSGYDDAFEDENTQVVTSGSDYLWLENGRFHVGYRFQDVAIPQGATINDCNFWVYVRSTTWDDPDCTIYGNDVDDADDFNDEQDIDARTFTGNTTTWIADAIGSGWRNKTITSLLQEVVDRSGWNNGNNFAILMIATDGSGDSFCTDAYDFDPGLSAFIICDWTYIIGDSPNYPSLNYPANNSVGHPLSVELNVTYSDPDGDTGTVWFYNNISGSYLGSDTGVVNNTFATWTWGSLSWGTKYQWHVIANDGNYNSSIDAFFVFYTNYRPTYSLNYPANNSENIPLTVDLNVTYSDFEGSSGTVWFYNNKTGSYLGSDTGVANNTFATYTWSGLTHTTNYYWHVIASDGSLNSTLTIFFNFTTLSVYVNVTYYHSYDGMFWVDNATFVNGTEIQYLEGSTTVELTALTNSTYGWFNFTYSNATYVFGTYTENPEKTVALNYNGSLWCYFFDLDDYQPLELIELGGNDTGTLSAYPIDDSLLDQDQPDTVRGLLSWFRSGNDPSGDLQRTILKFNFTSIPETALITKAEIYIYLNYWKTSDSEQHDMYLVTNNGWTETTITWNNAPSYSDLLDTTNIGIGLGFKKFDSQDLIDAMNYERERADYNFSVIIRYNNEGQTDDYKDYLSTEYIGPGGSDRWPYIYIEYNYTALEPPVEEGVPIEFLTGSIAVAGFFLIPLCAFVFIMFYKRR